MKLLTNHVVRVFAAGLVVLTLLSIPLFWLRLLCYVSLCERIPDNAKEAMIEPSGFIARDIEQDPNLARPSRVCATMRPRPLLSLGIINYFQSRLPEGNHSSIFAAKSPEHWAYFDKRSGHLILTNTETMPDKNTRQRQVQFYVGPEGVSEIRDETLGRFIDPIIDRSWHAWGRRWERLHDLILYDRMLRRFFKIDFDNLTVIKSPEITKNTRHEPIQVGLLDKNPFLLSLNWLPPVIKISSDYRITHGMEFEPIIQTAHYGDAVPYLLVLDKTGRIDLLDKETLEFAGSAGQLPETQTLFGSERPATPVNVLSYNVKPVFLGAVKFPETFGGQDEQTDENVSFRYGGMIAASLSRDGTALAITAVDDQGQMPRWQSATSRWNRPSNAAYFDAPWAPVATIGKYLAENLHPPVLSLASYFTASTFEAGAGHRALFLLPNSFVAMVARDSRGNFAERLFSALGLMLPSIVLAIWLAWRVGKNAAVVGLSRKVRRWWTLGTIAFGLVGYITYRLTRPKAALVTCANCGHPRRPDMDKCHRCGSGWHVPELTPPAWRVLDGDGTERVSAYQEIR